MSMLWRNKHDGFSIPLLTVSNYISMYKSQAIDFTRILPMELIDCIFCHVWILSQASAIQESISYIEGQPIHMHKPRMNKFLRLRRLSKTFYYACFRQLFSRYAIDDFQEMEFLSNLPVARDSILSLGLLLPRSFSKNIIKGIKTFDSVYPFLKSQISLRELRIDGDISSIKFPNFPFLQILELEHDQKNRKTPLPHFSNLFEISSGHQDFDKETGFKRLRILNLIDVIPPPPNLFPHLKPSIVSLNILRKSHHLKRSSAFFLFPTNQIIYNLTTFSTSESSWESTSIFIQVLTRLCSSLHNLNLRISSEKLNLPNFPNLRILSVRSDVNWNINLLETFPSLQNSRKLEHLILNRMSLTKPHPDFVLPNKSFSVKNLMLRWCNAEVWVCYMMFEQKGLKVQVFNTTFEINEIQSQRKTFKKWIELKDKQKDFKDSRQVYTTNF